MGDLADDCTTSSVGDTHDLRPPDADEPNREEWLARRRDLAVD
jgi:hypothetical protein